MPDWRIKRFADKESLFEYISDPDYIKDDEKPGVCFGFEMKKVVGIDEDSWTLKAFLNDQD